MRRRSLKRTERRWVWINFHAKCSFETTTERERRLTVAGADTAPCARRENPFSPAARGVPLSSRSVHLASLREPRLEEFPVGGGSNKLKVRLGIRNLAALPVLATSGGLGHVAGTTALPLRADHRAATSAFLAWRSALPRTADAVGRGLPRPVMTLCGHWRACEK